MHLGFGLGLENLASYPIYIGGIIAFLLSVFWRPHIGLYYLLPFLPLQTLRYHLHDLPLGKSFVDILLLGVFLGLALRGQLDWKTPLNRLLLVSAIYYYVSLFRGSFYIGAPLPLAIDDPRFSDWKNFMVMPVLYLAVVGAIKDVSKMKVLVVLMILGTLMANRNIYNTTRGRDSSQFVEQSREGGPLGFVGANGMAAFEAQFAVFLLGIYACQKKKLLKWAILGVVATNLYCLTFSFSRGGYLGFLAGALFLGLVKERKLLPLLVVFLLFWQVIMPIAVQERVLMTHQSGELDPSAEDRVRLWQDAVSLIIEGLPIGIGFDTYKFLNRLGYSDTHNVYVKFAVETGFLGLFFLVWLLVKAHRMAYRLFRCSDDPFLSAVGLGFAACVVTAAVVNFFGDRWTYLQINGFFWAQMAIVAQGLMLTQGNRLQEQTEGSLEVPVSSVEGEVLTPDPVRLA